MIRDMSQPLDPVILQWGTGIKPIGDGVVDEGGALFLQKFNLPLFLFDQGVDPLRLPVQEGGDSALFVNRRRKK